MENKLCCNREKFMPVTKNSYRPVSLLCGIMLSVIAFVPQAVAGGDAPGWMHALVGANLPTYDEKADAVLLYSEENVTVLSADKIRTHVREAYKILRPEGRHHGTVGVYFDSTTKIASLRGWCIPAQGKDYEVKEKDAVDRAIPAEGGYLIQDVKWRVLTIPAPEPGNIVGYEYEVEEHPFWLQTMWQFQGGDPVRESALFIATSSGLGI